MNPDEMPWEVGENGKPLERPAWVRVFHTHVIELDAGKSLVLRLQSNGTIDVTVELSETECYGVEIPESLFRSSVLSFLDAVEGINHTQKGDDSNAHQDQAG